MSKLPHRGLKDDRPSFAKQFVLDRMTGFKKDIEICLRPTTLKDSGITTYAPFPALSACCATLEYMAALHKGGRLHTVGWRDVASWAVQYLPQPDYDNDTVRILFEAFRNSVAHRGIASGVWRDLKDGIEQRRVTWKFSQLPGRPSVRLTHEEKELLNDPPWPCRYTHRAYISLSTLAADVYEGAIAYASALQTNKKLCEKFFKCMEELYPR